MASRRATATAARLRLRVPLASLSFLSGGDERSNLVAGLNLKLVQGVKRTRAVPAARCPWQGSGFGRFNQLEAEFSC